VLIKKTKIMISKKQVGELVDNLMDRKMPVYGMIYNRNNPMNCFGRVMSKDSEFTIKLYESPRDYSHMVGSKFALSGITVEVTDYFPGESDGDRVYSPLLTFKIV
jgi:hypothetical protein